MLITWNKPQIRHRISFNLKFIFSYCSWCSWGKNNEVICHPFSSGPHFVRTLHNDPSLFGGLFNLYAEDIMWNSGLDDSQAWIKISGRNINSLNYVDDATLMAENEEEVKEPLDESERREWKSWLKFIVNKTKIMASSNITS